jgi:hypothetical protein
MGDDSDGEAEPSVKSQEKKPRKRKGAAPKAPMPRPPTTVSRGVLADGGKKRRRTLVQSEEEPLL